MQQRRGAVRPDGERRRSQTRELCPVLRRLENRGNVLRFHLDGLVGFGRIGIEQQTRPLGMVEKGAGPEERREEGGRALEIPGVQKQRPTLVSSGNILARGGGFRIREGQGKIAIAEQLATRALLEIQPVERKEQPRTELRDAVEAARMFPIARTVARTVGDPLKIVADAAHDELGRGGGEMCVAPPAQAALDVGVAFACRLSVRLILRMHPGAHEAALEIVAGIGPDQRPRSGVEGEAGVEFDGNAVAAIQEVAEHLARLHPGLGHRDGGIAGQQRGKAGQCRAAPRSDVSRLSWFHDRCSWVAREVTVPTLASCRELPRRMPCQSARRSWHSRDSGSRRSRRPSAGASIPPA